MLKLNTCGGTCINRDNKMHCVASAYAFNDDYDDDHASEWIWKFASSR